MSLLSTKSLLLIFQMNTMNKDQEPAKYKILIVDDIPKNIQLVANFLTKVGYQINFAVDGTSAIEHASKGDFDLILLDIMMPGIDGFEVCTTLKQNSITKDIPVIFLTAKTDNESISKGFDAGGVDYITKPFNPTELLARVKTHISLKNREKELRELNKTKDTFLSIIGHDLKTPLANIISLGDIIMNNQEISQDERNELVNDMVDSGRQGGWLLDNLLSWTRIQTGSITNKPESLDLNEIVHQNIDFVYQNAQHKGVDILVDCVAGIKIYADRNIVHTILRNLLSNGIKFTHGGGQIKIYSTQTPENEIRLQVIDTGIGIKPERLLNLFSKIGNTSTAGTQNEIGSGLGLVLVKDLIDLIDARIEVKSEVGKGTQFSIYFKDSQNV